MGYTKEEIIKKAYVDLIGIEAFNYHVDVIETDGKIFQYNIYRYLIPNLSDKNWDNSSGYYWPKSINENILKYSN